MKRTNDAIAESLERGGAPALLVTDCDEIRAGWVETLMGEADSHTFSCRTGTYSFEGEGPAVSGKSWWARTPRWDVRVLPVARKVEKFPITRRVLEIRLERMQIEFDEVVSALRQHWSVDGMTAMVIALENLRIALSDVKEAA